LSSSSECYWKADIIGRNSIGPSNYFITGFVVLDDKTFEEVTNGYAFVNEVPTFPAGMNPSVTSRTHFAWGANEEFTHELLGASFIGTVYFDSINGMVFFDVQNL
jgi:hypothetical protein